MSASARAFAAIAMPFAPAPITASVRMGLTITRANLGLELALPWITRRRDRGLRAP